MLYAHLFSQLGWCNRCDQTSYEQYCPCVRRVLTEWLQDEASEKGLAAAATSGAGALVEAAAASAQLEVSSNDPNRDLEPVT